MANKEQLAKLKKAIQGLDRELSDKLNERIELIMLIKRLSEKEGVVFSDPALDDDQLENLTTLNRGPLTDYLLKQLWDHIATFTKVVVDGKDLNHKGSIQDID